MTTTASTPDLFLISALPTHLLDQVRRSDTGAGGVPVEHLEADGGEPLRCCLRDARLGEAIILFGYEPPLPASPYGELGAVFAHASPCDGPALQGYPPAWRGRPQILRAYDRRGWIHDSQVHDGSDPAAAIKQLFADPVVVQVHSRNVAYGCFMFVITRAS